MGFSPAATERDQGGEGETAEGLPLPRTLLPRQALPPKMSLFTAMTQDFLLLEKRAFYGAWRDCGENWPAASPSESETHGWSLPAPAPAGPQGLSASQTPNIILPCFGPGGLNGDGRHRAQLARGLAPSPGPEHPYCLPSCHLVELALHPLTASIPSSGLLGSWAWTRACGSQPIARATPPPPPPSCLASQGGVEFSGLTSRRALSNFSYQGHTEPDTTVY